MEGDVLEIPETVRKELEKRGGVEGLTASLPAEETIDSMVESLHTLSDPNRLRILALLEAQPACPCILTRAVGVTDSQLSYHLSVLQHSGLIQGKHRGRWIIYELTEKGRETLETVRRLP